MKSNKRLLRSRGCRRGVTSVEFALCCPILFMFTFGSLEFSRVNMIRQTVENAVYEGCRRGIVPGATSADVTDATQFVLNTVSASDAQITVVPTVITKDTANVNVSVVVPVNANTWVPSFFFKNRQISGELTMRRERGLSSNIQ
jgi:Flp pilus assembly protein TadG